MKNQPLFIAAVAAIAFFADCNPQEDAAKQQKAAADFKKTNVYGSMEAYGGHLVTIMGCNDCHTPKKMGPHGPELDSTLLMSGHPAGMPAIQVDRKAMAGAGLIVTRDLTEWVGPWGVSYTANLTPDETGLASWTLDQFKIALRQGKYHGIQNGRMLLPPMPWDMIRHLSDDEMAAVFAYLKSLPPVSNLVPPPLPPAR